MPSAPAGMQPSEPAKARAANALDQKGNPTAALGEDDARRDPARGAEPGTAAGEEDAQIGIEAPDGRRKETGQDPREGPRARTLLEALAAEAPRGHHKREPGQTDRGERRLVADEEAQQAHLPPSWARPCRAELSVRSKHLRVRRRPSWTGYGRSSEPTCDGAS
jgi:hypothetical protein